MYLFLIIVYILVSYHTLYNTSKSNVDHLTFAVENI